MKVNMNLAVSSAILSAVLLAIPEPSSVPAVVLAVQAIEAPQGEDREGDVLEVIPAGEDGVLHHRRDRAQGEEERADRRRPLREVLAQEEVQEEEPADP